MDTIIKRLTQIRYIPMIKSVGVDQAEALGTALLAGGLPAANISQQTDDGLELLRILSTNFPDIVTGGGNVQTVGEARNAIEAGILAVEQGLKVIGFYPVEKLGGLPAIDHMADLFGLKFIVAGGITEKTVLRYLSHKHVVAVTGSWMIDPLWVASEQWGLVTKAIRHTASLND
jgi:2-dehydro-3-deoxyphosphogluconate aldolase/(4S)-4-hydroxy-2-oxoglutarate aldolase